MAEKTDCAILKNHGQKLLLEIDKFQKEGNWSYIYHSLLPILKNHKDLPNLNNYNIIAAETIFELYLTDNSSGAKNWNELQQLLINSKRLLSELPENSEFELERRLLLFRIHYASGSGKKMAYENIENVRNLEQIRKEIKTNRSITINVFHCLIMAMCEKGKCIEDLKLPRKLAIEAYDTCIDSFKQSKKYSIKLTRLCRVYNEAIYRSAMLRMYLGETMEAIDSLRFLCFKTNASTVTKEYREKALDKLPYFLLFYVCDEMYRPPSGGGKLDLEVNFTPKTRLEEAHLLLQLLKKEVLMTRKSFSRVPEKSSNTMKTTRIAVKFYDGLLLSHSMMDEMSENKTLYSEALEFGYQHAHLWQQYGLSLINNKDYKRACGVFKRCIATYALGKSITCHLLLAKLYFNYLNKTQKALNYCMKALEYAKSERWFLPVVYHCCGLCHAKLSLESTREISQYNEKMGIELLSKACELQPSNGTFLTSLCLLYGNMRKIKKASELMKKLEHFEETPKNLHISSLIHACRKEHGEALEKIRTVFSMIDSPRPYDKGQHQSLKINDIINIHLTLAQFYLCDGQIKNCFKIYSAALEYVRLNKSILKSKQSHGNFQKSTVHMHLIEGNYGLPLDSNFTYINELEMRVLLDQASTNVKLKMYNDALARLQDAFNINATPELFHVFGLYHESQLEISKAIIQYNKGIALGKHTSDCHVGLGRCHLHLKQNELAESHLNQAIQMNSHSHEAWFHLGKIYSASDRNKEAIRAYSKAADLKENEPIVPFSRIPFEM